MPRNRESTFGREPADDNPNDARASRTASRNPLTWAERPLYLCTRRYLDRAPARGRRPGAVRTPLSGGPWASLVRRSFFFAPAGMRGHCADVLLPGLLVQLQRVR